MLSILFINMFQVCDLFIYLFIYLLFISILFIDLYIYLVSKRGYGPLLKALLIQVLILHLLSVSMVFAF